MYFCPLERKLLQFACLVTGLNLGLLLALILPITLFVCREFLPESFMRKDDVFYEELKQIVKKRFGIHNDDTEQHPSHCSVAFRNIRQMSRVILGLLDDFTNRGLFCIAKVLTEDSIDFEKTLPQMERVIRKSLGVLQGQQCPNNQDKIQSQVSKLLGNQKNFRHNHIKHLNVTLKSHRAAVIKVLDGLGDIRTQALSAMYRKLKGVHGYVPVSYTHLTLPTKRIV